MKRDNEENLLYERLATYLKLYCPCSPQLTLVAIKLKLIVNDQIKYYLKHILMMYV